MRERANTAFVLVLAAVVLAPAAASAEPFVKGPYLQNVSTTAITVMFETLIPTVGVVHYGATREYGLSATSSRQNLHEIRLGGLKPSTIYHYQVEANGVRSGDLTFTTAAGPGESFRFIVYGDNRGGHDAHAQVVAAIDAEDADFVVNTGDMVGDGSDDEQWQVFFDIERRLLDETTMFPVIGNHEAFSSMGKVRYRHWFSLPEDSLFPEQDYVFTYGSARFVVLTAYEDFPPAQMEWLEQQLQDAVDDPAIEHRFVFIHHGPFSSGPHGGNVEGLRAGLARILRAGDVDVVFSGHDHDYERGRVSGINYVVSGGGGAPLYDIDAPRPGSAVFESTYHHVRVDVVGASLELTSVRPDGSVIDRCSALGAGPWECTQGESSARPDNPAPAPVPHRPPALGCDGGGAAALVLPLGALALVSLYAFSRRRARDRNGRQPG